MSDLEAWPTGKCGVVAIVGRPNVGKSTFLNQVLRFHLTAVSPKPQTTRRQWRGILSDEESQIIFTDTPGVHLGRHELGQVMLRSVSQSLEDADVVLCIGDPSRPCGDEDELVAERVAAAKKPTLVVLNKEDIAKPAQKQAAANFFSERLGASCELFNMSALTGDGTTEVLARLRALLPEGPFFYPPDQVTDAFERDIGAELIREAALEHLREEVPHAVAVEIEQWQADAKKLKVRAVLYVEREQQKQIVLGRDGNMIKAIQRDAIGLIREMSDVRVDLRIYVKVARDWRNQSSFLKDLGLS